MRFWTPKDKFFIKIFKYSIVSFLAMSCYLCLLKRIFLPKVEETLQKVVYRKPSVGFHCAGFSDIDITCSISV